MSENLEAQRLVEMLNRFFTEMSRVVFEAGGTVDKFIGDCIMALFGAPVPSENSADQALAAALEMQRAVEAMAILGNCELSIGIGIHRGPAVVGNVGSRDRVQYTAIGDTVNVAARLVSLAEPGQIVFSEVFRDSLSSVTDALSLGEVELKGRRQNLKLFAVNHRTSERGGVS
jgi:adenylate cyclase